jgi:flagellin-like hook-associated protein FlgL
MAVIPSNLTRVSNNLRTAVATSNLTRTQVGLLKVQNQLATGKQLSVPSDDPGAAAIIQSIRKTLEQRDAYLANLKSAQNHLSAVDTSLGELTDLLREADQIASANVGSDVSADARSSAAAIVGRIYSQLLTLGNRQFEGTYLFGGDRATSPPFVETGGGVKFVGSDRVLFNDSDENAALPFMVDGNEVWGALTTRIQGSADLTPSVTSATRLADLRGANGNGVQRGSILLGNGSASMVIDLSAADTVGDVVDRINAAGVGGITASIGTTGLQLSAGVADDITVLEVGGGTTATDLGIARAAGAGAGAPLAGAAIGPRVTELTPLSALKGGAGVDLSGLVITNGQFSQTIDLSTAVTVQDLLNAVNGGTANVRAAISDDGMRINLLNPTQGLSLTVGENGGTTADDLGVRSMTAASPISELNGGKGVRTVVGVDLSITDSNGVTFGVDVDGAATIQELIAAINTAATSGGAGVTASIASNGNGLVLTDTAAGAGTMAVANAPFSQAVQDLGLDQPISGGVIAGSDVNPVQSQGIFANVLALQNALRASDQRGITDSAERLKADLDRIVRVRGETGARVQELEDRQRRLEDQNVTTKALLSELEDVDFTEAITRFQTLQTALQATLQSAGVTLNLSLLDFLA